MRQEDISLNKSGLLKVRDVCVTLVLSGIMVISCSSSESQKELPEKTENNSSGLIPKDTEERISELLNQLYKSSNEKQTEVIDALYGIVSKSSLEMFSELRLRIERKEIKKNKEFIGYLIAKLAYWDRSEEKQYVKMLNELPLDMVGKGLIYECGFIYKTYTNTIIESRRKEFEEYLYTLLDDSRSYFRTKSAVLLFWLNCDRKYEAVPQLLEDEGDLEKDTEEAVVDILYGERPEKLTDELIEALSDKKSGVRSNAAFWLKGYTRANPFLLKMLKDSDDWVRIHAASTLLENNCFEEEIINTLIEIIRKGDKFKDVKAALVLREAGNKALKSIPLPKEQLAKPHIKYEAAMAIASIDPSAKEAVPVLIELLKQDYYDSKINAAGSLGQMGAVAKDAVPELTKTLFYKDERARHPAAFALSGIGLPARSAVPEIIRAYKEQYIDYESVSYITKILVNEEGGKGILGLLYDSNPDLKYIALEAIPHAKIDLNKLIPTLLNNLLSPYSGVREESMKILKGMRISEERIVEKLTTALDLEEIPKITIKRKRGSTIIDKPAEGIKYFALNELSYLGSSAEPALPKLLELLESGNEWTHQCAITAIGSIGNKAERAISALLPFCDSDKKGVKGRAVRALGEIGAEPDKVFPVFIRLLKDKEEYIRRCAAYAISCFGVDASADAVRKLTKLLNDPVRDVRIAGIIALGKTGPIALPSLDEMLKLLDDPYQGLWQEAAIAIGRIGPKGKKAIPHLLGKLDEILDDPEWKVDIFMGNYCSVYYDEDLMANISNEYPNIALIDALLSLGYLRSELHERLIRKLSGQKDKVSLELLYCFMRIGDASSIPYLSAARRIQKDENAKRMIEDIIKRLNAGPTKVQK